MVKVKASGAERVLSAPQSLLKRGFSATLSIVLAASLCGVAPSAAFASEADRWAEAVQEQVSDKGIQTYSMPDSAAVASLQDGTETLPSSYDLRNPGVDNFKILDEDRKLKPASDDSVVTPVKLQNPWGTCWGFSIIAACETSILSSTGQSYKSTGMDLSELQLTGSVFKNNGLPASVSQSQATEGYHNSSKNPNAGYDMGGTLNYAATVFASGVGPLYEKTVPYKNKEGIITCLVQYQDGTSVERNLTEDQIAQIEEDESVASVKKRWYAGNYKDEQGNMVYTDWTVDDSLYTSSLLNLTDSNILPETRVLDKEGKYESTDPTALENVKREIHNGRAVSASFTADHSTPGKAESKAKYINENWAHYTYKAGTLQTHAVTIVGYDDKYLASNFGNADDLTTQPEGDGAWLVKNSWGSETEEFPNQTSDWGLEDADGKHTGYFWLSYYDKSITEFETFEFETQKASDSSEYYIDQYDYLPQIGTYCVYANTPISSANIFTVNTADSDTDEGYGSIAVRTLSCATYVPSTDVTYQVYLLDDQAVSPTDPEHSELVYTKKASYDYGGYHRTELNPGEWINLRDGQRYAVVTTQQCVLDGKYYQGVAVNKTKPTDDQIAQYKESVTASTTEKYRKKIYEQELQSYKAQHPECSDDEAKAYAEQRAAELVKSESTQALIKEDVDAAMDEYQNSYYTAIVNEGESWTGSTEAATEPKVDDTTVWDDWKTAVKETTEAAVREQDGVEVVADNAPVKAFAEFGNYASYSELNALADALAKAKELLASVKVSADGSDVSVDDQWMTQAEYDALKAAVASAEELLSNAGDYASKLKTVAEGSPTSSEVAAATEFLGATAKPGTKAAVVPAPEPTSQQDGPADGAKTHSAKTADTAATAAGALACVVVVAGAAAAVARRRQRG